MNGRMEEKPNEWMDGWMNEWYKQPTHECAQIMMIPLNAQMVVATVRQASCACMHAQQFAQRTSHNRHERTTVCIWGCVRACVRMYVSLFLNLSFPSSYVHITISYTHGRMGERVNEQMNERVRQVSKTIYCSST
eukprot:GHVU01023091.1.p1 GENE.GHVU01023091.1~~GHVU01023091.1.p1  ORF type:complete len:135 (-),score=5.51 GHVU01023091.1:351-755(-)